MTSYSYTYCPYCGGGLAYEDDHYKCVNKHVIYKNSAPAVGAIIYDGGSRVLLTRRSSDPFKGHWDIPGGFLEYGEHPENGIHREIMEELGIEIRIVEFLGHFISNYGENSDEDGKFVLNIFYVIKADISKAQASDDINAFEWFDLTDLPEKLAFPVNRLALENWHRKLKSQQPLTH